MPDSLPTLDLLNRTLGCVRPIAYTGGNLFEPVYAAAAVENEILARAPVTRVRPAVGRALWRYLRYCLQYSPFWRERWPKDHLRFGEEEAEDVLALLPPLTKEDLRRHGPLLHVKPEQRRSDDGFPRTPRQMRIKSGGSTGVPTEVWHDKRFAARNRAIMDHAYRTCGLTPGRPTFYLWGSNNELTDIKGSTRKRLSTWARGLIPMPAFALDVGTVRQYVSCINERREVRAALCFVSALDTMLDIVEREGLTLRRIYRVITGGGKLLPQLRDRVRRLWADDVYEIYGTRDAGLIGAEAPDHDGIQIFPWHSYVEVLNKGVRVKPGEVGEIHVTCVRNYSCALIRLGMGDVGQLHRNSDAWNRPRIADIIGRTAEHLSGVGGRRIDPSAVIHLIGVLEAPPWMRRFQLVQLGPTKLVLRLEVWTTPSKEETNRFATRIENALGRVMGGPVVLRTEILDRIPPTASGKHLYCVGWSPSS